MKERFALSAVRCDYADVSESRAVYLTFDDGPNPFCTPEVLDVLAQHQVPATFFVIGTYVTEHPELIRRMIAEGHEIANHTMTHPDLSKCGPSELHDEVLTASEAIRLACPQAAPRHMRAPYGIWTQEVLAMSASAGLTAVHWSIDPRDWSRPGVDGIVNSVLANVRPGAIVLLHDGYPPDEEGLCTDASLRDQTTMALAYLIPALQRRGFEIRPLPQLH
ncbi:chitooligosaccharide deacetylase NodB [Bradyrhizobium yuanmingense]|uniref:chitooligosaccharide deacetylase NodB n=1 Tax=Bradyrhizobium yuanmingense TaxID=108015 RepID=UPI0021A888B9|nr:chitooligosaccharide deacetylase NodB [Bradyrhizobium sp. CB1024]UWU82934.1 chitooligosaccharide deacetylase NodB [Bradyrhizobium sp. CB1024]